MNITSLDPRINRLEEPPAEVNVTGQDYWHTYEVFHLAKRGGHHMHVGAVHAPDPEIALLFAKEQFGRRSKCVNMWVIKTADIYSFRLEDEDMFDTTPDKQHRESAMYKVRERIQAFRERQGQNA